MLKIGKTYQLIAQGYDVDIVGSGVGENMPDHSLLYSGQFFVGITRNADTGARGDWVANYKPDGTRIWDTPPASPPTSNTFNLHVPPILVDLSHATKLIRNLASSLDISEDAAETVIGALEELDGVR